jgi:hypothetical protein
MAVTAYGGAVWRIVPVNVAPVKSAGVMVLSRGQSNVNVGWLPCLIVGNWMISSCMVASFRDIRQIQHRRTYLYAIVAVKLSWSPRN